MYRLAPRNLVLAINPSFSKIENISSRERCFEMSANQETNN